jgi:uncharacterized protein YndB with AHSA1/START domain
MDEKKTTFEVDKDKLEVRMVRVFNASKEAIFKAYSDPELIVKWWGPAEYETILDKMDFRLGGEWRFIHKETNGTLHPFHGVYKEIIENERITDTFNYEPIGPGHELVETIVLEDMGGKTKLTAVSKYNTIEDLEGMILSGMEGGATESMERLAKLVEKD